MPIYEYQCDSCGHVFEKIQKFSDAPIDVCPKCGGPVHKLQSAPAFQFKGTGWYVTDYAKSGQPESKETKKPSESAKTEPASGESTRTESSKTESTKSESAPSTPPASTKSGD
jgi:putative FmdB family regulatory protein